MTQPHLRAKQDRFDEVSAVFNEKARQIAADLVWAGEATPEEALVRARLLAKQRFKRSWTAMQEILAPIKLITDQREKKD